MSGSNISSAVVLDPPRAGRDGLALTAICLVALMFGPRYMATLFGIVFLSHQIGAFIGVWLGGYLFDTMGTYNFVWWSGVGLGVLAALLHWPIVEKPIVREPVAA